MFWRFFFAERGPAATMKYHCFFFIMFTKQKSHQVRHPKQGGVSEKTLRSIKRMKQGRKAGTVLLHGPAATTKYHAFYASKKGVRHR